MNGPMGGYGYPSQYGGPMNGMGGNMRPAYGAPNGMLVSISCSLYSHPPPSRLVPLYSVDLET